MTRTFDFGELRSLLQQPPSPQAWDALCKLVSGADWDTHAEQWLPYAQDLLDRQWPDTLRAWPAAWRSSARQPAASALVRWAMIVLAGSPDPKARLDALRRAKLPLAGLRLFGAPGFACAAPLAACLPASLAELHLCDVPLARGDALLAHPTLDHLRCLSLDRAGLAHKAASALFERDLAALTELSLAQNSLHSEDLRPLARHSVTARLTSLDLSYNMAGLSRALSASRDPADWPLAQASWPALTTLIMDRASPSGDALNAALAQMPALSALRLVWYTDATPLALPALASLDLSEAQLSDEALAQTLALPALAQTLTQLTLDRVRVGPATMRALAALASLRALSLNGHHDPPQLTRALDALAGCTLPALTSLDLRWGTHDLATIRALCAIDMPALRKLHIHLQGDAADPRRVLIQQAPWFSQLEINHTRYDHDDLDPELP